MNSSHLKALLMSLRLPFLLLTPICLSVGVALAYQATGYIDISRLILVLLGGLSAHASVNLFNEYSDYSSGLDKITEKTPFSGGSGGLLQYPKALQMVFISAVVCLLLVIGIGLYFVWWVNLVLLPIGMLGVLLVVFYTDYVNRRPWVCLIAPGLAFGPVMVVGGYMALTGGFSWLSLWLSAIPFLLVNNLLLLNQLPDIDADRQVGRKHIPIRYGWQASLLIYVLFSLAAVVMLLLLARQGILSHKALWACLPLTFTLLVAAGIYKNFAAPSTYVPWLALNVVITLVTPVILSLSLL